MENKAIEDKKATIAYDHVKVEPDAQIALHHQPTWELSYIIRGCGKRIVGDTEDAFNAGELVLVVPGMPHQWIFNQKGADKHGRIENVTVCFPADLLRRLAAVIPEYSDITDWLENLHVSIKLEHSEAIGKQMQQMESLPADQRITSLLNILSEIRHSSDVKEAGSVAATQDRTEKVKTWLRCNYQREVRLEQLAEYVGMNKSSMCTYFKQQTGETIFGYLTALRIKAARHLLENDNISISTCCYKCGFNDVPHFSRVFKRVTGLSPMQYKKTFS